MAETTIRVVCLSRKIRDTTTPPSRSLHAFELPGNPARPRNAHGDQLDDAAGADVELRTDAGCAHEGQQCIRPAPCLLRHAVAAIPSSRRRQRCRVPRTVGQPFCRARTTPVFDDTLRLSPPLQKRIDAEERDCHSGPHERQYSGTNRRRPIPRKIRARTKITGIGEPVFFREFGRQGNTCRQ